MKSNGKSKVKLRHTVTTKSGESRVGHLVEGLEFLGVPYFKVSGRDERGPFWWMVGAEDVASIESREHDECPNLVSPAPPEKSGAVDWEGVGPKDSFTALKRALASLRQNVGESGDLKEFISACPKLTKVIMNAAAIGALDVPGVAVAATTGNDPIVFAPETPFGEKDVWEVYATQDEIKTVKSMLRSIRNFPAPKLTPEFVAGSDVEAEVGLGMVPPSLERNHFKFFKALRENEGHSDKVIVKMYAARVGEYLAEKIADSTPTPGCRACLRHKLMRVASDHPAFVQTRPVGFDMNVQNHDVKAALLKVALDFESDS